jgi:predicted ATP-dependent serine protease
MKPKFNKELLKGASETSDKKEELTTAEITEKLKEDLKKAKANKGLFIVKKASDWIEESKKRPAPKMLFYEFWHEGETCILFADTNVGKSILAVQIGNDLAKKYKVLYLDFELSDKQFELRYSDYNHKNHYQFPKNFLRAEINPDSDPPKGKFEEFLNESLEKVITETNIEILIVDNITYLSNENEKAKDALPLMKHLKALKEKFKISLLVLAHTPKRDERKPITRNDLQGSKMLMNFCDSSFAIGESQLNKSERYLKQIKNRSTEKVYDAKNVMLYKIIKPENYLKFEFICYADEYDLLVNSDSNFNDKKAIARQMKEEGATINEIMDKLDVSKGWASTVTSDITKRLGRNKSSKKEDPESDSLF